MVHDAWITDNSLPFGQLSLTLTGDKHAFLNALLLVFFFFFFLKLASLIDTYSPYIPP